ncbi:hypothetical protein B0H15DRAFT_62236 [Mycena belliarum]|uniref:Uncharacterized protein n=1 Tax=Mycena belliarum TaxID=1033014 RepID=A0AAD6TMW0_9AGAR|nr:hypothetical protein B0H15DRAFT_62236 [Mycena belliae]
MSPPHAQISSTRDRATRESRVHARRRALRSSVERKSACRVESESGRVQGTAQRQRPASTASVQLHEPPRQPQRQRRLQAGHAQLRQHCPGHRRHRGQPEETPRAADPPSGEGRTPNGAGSAHVDSRRTPRVQRTASREPPVTSHGRRAPLARKRESLPSHPHYNGAGSMHGGAPRQRWSADRGSSSESGRAAQRMRSRDTRYPQEAPAYNVSPARADTHREKQEASAYRTRIQRARVRGGGIRDPNSAADGGRRHRLREPSSSPRRTGTGSGNRAWICIDGFQ